MPRVLFANNAVSVIPASLGAAATVLTLAAGQGALFPAPGADEYFKLTLEDRRTAPIKREIVHCLARTGDVLTIQRGQESTPAQAFDAGFVASHRTTAGILRALSDGIASFSDLWLGVHDTPPVVNGSGGPLEEGALYFDSVTETNYAWDGSAWRAQLVPAPGVTMRLFYVATGGQTEFGNAPDEYGNTLNLTVALQQPVVLLKNGLQQFLDDGTGTKGTYTVDYATNRCTLLVPAVGGDRIELEQLVHPSQLAPTVVDLRLLRDINLDPVSGTPGYIDGVRTTFKLRDQTNNPVSVTGATNLQIYLDGVQQQPGAAYTVLLDEVTFTEAPPAGTAFWGEFFAVAEP